MGCTASSHPPYVFGVLETTSSFEDTLKPLQASSTKSTPSPARFRSTSVRHVNPSFTPTSGAFADTAGSPKGRPESPTFSARKSAQSLSHSMRSVSQRHLPGHYFDRSPGLSPKDFGGDALPSLSLPRTPTKSSQSLTRNSLTDMGVPRSAISLRMRDRADSSSHGRPSASSHLQKFEVDDFEEKIILGRGGFAWVRLKLHIPSQLFYAVKSVKKSASTSRRTIADLIDEKKAIIALNNSASPFIVKFHGSYQVWLRLLFCPDV